MPDWRWASVRRRLLFAALVVASAGFAAVSLTMMFSGYGASGVCAGLSVIVIGPFVVRLYCEFLIVVFRINETLTEILHTLRGRPPI